MNQQTYFISIPGLPAAKTRPRFSKYGTYDTQKYIKLKLSQQIWYELREIDQSYIVDEPSFFHIKIDFFLNFPNFYPKNKRDVPVPHKKKPDIDNLVKFVLDAMNGIVYKDDNSVFKIEAAKYQHLKPRTEITIIKFKEGGKNGS